MLLKKFNLQLHILWSNNPATITYLSSSDNTDNLSTINYELTLSPDDEQLTPDDEQQQQQDDAIDEQDGRHHAVNLTPHLTLTLQPDLLNSWSDHVMYQYHSTQSSKVPPQHRHEQQEEEREHEHKQEQQHDHSAPTKWQHVQDNAELELWVIYPQQKYAIIPQKWF